MSSQPPPIETEEQETADFLATQFVFGNGEHPTVGLDVLVTKVAVDFVGLTSETARSGGVIMRNAARSEDREPEGHVAPIVSSTRRAVAASSSVV